MKLLSRVAYKHVYFSLLQGLLSEVEVKYKLSQCYMHMKEFKEATAIVCRINVEMVIFLLENNTTYLYDYTRQFFQCWFKDFSIISLKVFPRSRGLSKLTCAWQNYTNGKAWKGTMYLMFAFFNKWNFRAMTPTFPWYL